MTGPGVPTRPSMVRVARGVAALVGMLSVATLRIAAVLRGLHLPIFNLRDDGGSK